MKINLGNFQWTITTSFIDILSLDTEYDKNVVKAILGMLLTTNDLELTVIKGSVAKKRLSLLDNICTESDNAELAATDMLKLRLSGKKEKIKNELDDLEKTLEKSELSKNFTKDLETKEEVLSKGFMEIQELPSQRTKYSDQKFKQATKRLAAKLVKENRIKARKLGAGAQPLLDSKEEEFVGNGIVSKSTTLGRRKDAALYLNNRVKCEGLLSLTNYSLYKRGNRLIKSATTIYMFGRPRLNTIEGRRHRGAMLFAPKSLQKQRNILQKQPTIKELM